MPITLPKSVREELEALPVSKRFDLFDFADEWISEIVFGPKRRSLHVAFEGATIVPSDESEIQSIRLAIALQFDSVSRVFLGPAECSLDGEVVDWGVEGVSPRQGKDRYRFWFNVMGDPGIATFSFEADEFHVVVLGDAEK